MQSCTYPVSQSKVINMLELSYYPTLHNLLEDTNLSYTQFRQQWFHQHLSLSVVKGNAASILTCVHVWSDFICSQSTNQYCWPSFVFVLMHGCCFPNVCAFWSFDAPCAVLFWSFVSYLDYCIGYGEAIVTCSTSLLTSEVKKLRKSANYTQKHFQGISQYV